ncbi:hydrogen peroxide-inducible genes activator [Corynebacterium cystitidis]|uniref:Probable hydrogen peroxide-inducible genes activator n=1 Tax=Corynebacterium cystitidis DSM 20524 TaxID=1121357 RepID=A0A1H9P829_9CORY|nr:hydrogen peroxide-inducible genes activator [Corynebacterium cystitidis]WJY82592.1 putative hydrogen peroxide-inducible genes activator [Corynebacterium cystitidis DSM 20524]SER44227.1 LysR family transcriptional regulator, hydrogen peroxide-inducible genes activator [Corynebacterium cystitidis DSM 20524]SNV73039.1 LysR family transcriptional regulator [Corynebacterium cystitidis]
MSNKEYRPTLAQLRTFVTIAENKHFGTAANKLSISQPSLSQALVALETGLGVQLIERSTRKVIVTPIGEQLLPYAKSTLEAADQFINHSRGAHGVLTGPLTIGIIPTVAPYILPELLRSLKREYPDMEPRIVEEQTKHLLTQLRDGKIDLAVMALPSDSAGMVDYPLYDERFIIVLPEGHKYTGRQDLTLEVMEDLDLLLLDDGHCLRDQVVDLCRLADINPSEATDAVTRASSLTTIIQLVVAGLGTTLVPESALSTECIRSGLALANFEESVSAQRTIGLVYRTSSSRADEYEALGELMKKAFEAAKDHNKDLLNS